MDEQLGIFDPPCAYCGAPSTRLCDGIMSFPGDAQGYIRTNMTQDTCDRPMCADCVPESNPVFYKLRDEGCVIDYRDYCEECVRRRNAGWEAPIVTCKPDYLHKL